MTNYIRTSVLLLSIFFLVPSAFSKDADKCNIGEITILKNKKTRRSTIIRELEFAENDTVFLHQVPEILEKSKQNLLNTSLFNFVDIKPLWSADSSKVDVNIEVLERWYVWPVPLFEVGERNFNSWWKDKDFSRLNYGLMMKWDNFTGRKDELKFIFRFGYEDKFGLFYQLPYITKKQNIGINYGISYSRYHEVAVASVDNDLEYFKNTDEYIQKNFETYFQLIYRPEIHQKQYVEINYRNIFMDDELLNLYPDFTVNNINQLSFFSLSYNYINDHRDYVPYPLEGSYFDIELRKVGLNIFQSNGVDFFYIKSNFNNYWKLKDRWYFGTGLSAKISNNGYQPYVLQKGLGYQKDYMRSYELYVMDGQHYGMLRSNLKYELIPKRIHHFKFIKNEKFGKMFYAFYVNLFFDFAYVNDEYNAELNPLVNELQFGSGLGLDFVTYYSLVFRAEFSVNKLGDTNVFFHVKAPF